jgi:small subunit ribosomal protein S6e|tara:strand:+ start:97 stop:564 length:468 start_codon:yes stop_codon:yes gene_type:complete
MVKCVINDVKTGKSFQTEIEQNPAKGMKLGDKLEGGSVGLSGYEFEITGGSDQCGFPLRKDLHATTRKKPLFVTGVGLRKNKKKDRVRKTVAPNVIRDNTSQLNLKILKYGTKKLEETLGKKEEDSEEAPKEEKPKEEPKVEEKKEEAPKEEKKN